MRTFTVSQKASNPGVWGFGFENLEEAEAFAMQMTKDTFGTYRETGLLWFFSGCEGLLLFVHSREDNKQEMISAFCNGVKLREEQYADYVGHGKLKVGDRVTFDNDLCPDFLVVAKMPAAVEFYREYTYYVCVSQAAENGGLEQFMLHNKGGDEYSEQHSEDGEDQWFGYTLQLLEPGRYLLVKENYNDDEL